jgi:hypothetical protein
VAGNHDDWMMGFPVLMTCFKAKVIVASSVSLLAIANPENLIL